MRRAAKFLCSVGVAALVGSGSERTLLAQTNAGRLTIQLTNVIDEPIMDYEHLDVPVVPADGGIFVVPIMCYCGPAIVLGVEDCGNDSLLIESSTDLVNWAPFPQPGLQLTLGTGGTEVIPITGPRRFFRGVRE